MLADIPLFLAYIVVHNGRFVDYFMLSVAFKDLILLLKATELSLKKDILKFHIF